MKWKVIDEGRFTWSVNGNMVVYAEIGEVTKHVSYSVNGGDTFQQLQISDDGIRVQKIIWTGESDLTSTFLVLTQHNVIYEVDMGE